MKTLRTPIQVTLSLAIAGLAAGCPAIMSSTILPGSSSSSGGGGGGSRSISPPSWLQGRWQDGNGSLTIEVTSSEVTQSGQRLSQLAESQDSSSDNYTIRAMGGTSFMFERIGEKEVDYSASSTSGTLRLWKDGVSPIAPPSWLAGTWSNDFGLMSWTFTSNSAKGPGGDVTKMFRSQTSSSSSYTLKYGASMLESEVTFKLRTDGKCLEVSTKATSGSSTSTETLCKK